MYVSRNGLIFEHKKIMDSKVSGKKYFYLKYDQSFIINSKWKLLYFISDIVEKNSEFS